MTARSNKRGPETDQSGAEKKLKPEKNSRAGVLSESEEIMITYQQFLRVCRENQLEKVRRFSLRQ